MVFELPIYREPDFSGEPFQSFPDAVLVPVAKPGVAPENYHATTIYPEYIKVGGRWLLACESRMDCVIVVHDGEGLEVKEFRRLGPGERVVVGRSEDGRQGIYVYASGFGYGEGAKSDEPFVFRTGRTRETAYSKDYDRLYELLEYERNNGYVVWVLGPAVAFDSDSRKAMSGLIMNGYVNAVLAGNALATHDLEASIYKTGLGQNIYTQESEAGGHYNHLDTLNKARAADGIDGLIREEHIEDGIVAACVKAGVPLVSAGSIRDDGPLPETIADVYKSQDAMRAHCRKATTLIALATQLHAIASGNMTPSYQVVDGTVRPAFIYIVDVSEFAVNKLRDRGSLEVTSIVTNVQDFLVLLGRHLL